MTEYELVWEIKNQCPNNQMRDIFFEEIETEDPEAYVRTLLNGRAVDVDIQRYDGGAVTIHATADGIRQKFVFTPV